MSWRTAVAASSRLGYPGLAVLDTALAVVGGRVGGRLSAQRLRRFSKPALMPLLAGRLVTVAPSRTRTLTGVGVALSGVGDTALLGSSDTAFTVGLGAFLAGHLSYAAAFAGRGGAAGLRRHPLRAAPAAALAAAAGLLLLPKAGELRVPVAAYTAVISMMAAFAVGTGNRSSAGGAALFCVSDLTLAIIRFRGTRLPDGVTDVAVMATYTAGQALIVRGLAGSELGAR